MTNILISKDFDVIFIDVLVILNSDDFHQCIDGFFNLHQCLPEVFSSCIEQKKQQNLKMVNRFEVGVTRN